MLFRSNPLLHYSNILLAFNEKHVSSANENKSVDISNTEYFIVNAIELSSDKRIYPSQIGSFILYTAIEGDTEIVTNDKNKIKLQRGRSVMIPASMEDFIIRPSDDNHGNGKSVVMEIYMPQPQEEEDDYLI